MGQVIDDQTIQHYARLDRENSNRTIKRLEQLRDLGMEQVGNAQFGLRNVMSGLYVEMVWSHTDEQWDDYIKWVVELAAEKKPINDQARAEAITELRGYRAHNMNVFDGRFEVRGDEKLLKVTRGSDGRYYVYYSVGMRTWTFTTTPEEIAGMTVQEALKFLNIEDYWQRIYHSNSRGELFHVAYYVEMANYLKLYEIDASGFREWFEGLVKEAERTWKRPESMFQHMDKVFGDYLNKQKSKVMSDTAAAETFNRQAANAAQAAYCKETGKPHFAPSDGKCWKCHGEIYDKISVEKASRELITGCPICYKSYCD